MRYDKIDLRDHMWGMHHMAANLSAQNSLKYAHFPMHNMFTKNKFAKANKAPQDTCNWWHYIYKRDTSRGIYNTSVRAHAGRQDVIYHPDGVSGPAPGYAPWQIQYKKHLWQSFDTEIRMETPISSVVLSGTPIEEHVERIMVDMLIKQPNASLGETVHMLL
jgi:hypothetical protein